MDFVEIKNFQHFAIIRNGHKTDFDSIPISGKTLNDTARLPNYIGSLLDFYLIFHQTNVHMFRIMFTINCVL